MRLLMPVPEAEAARRLALLAFAGRKRRGGEDYFNHLRRVAAAVPPELHAAAWLHDALEDTPLTPTDLIAFGFSRTTIMLVTALTKIPDEPYELYIQNVRQYPDAVIIKIADINDNLADDPTDAQKEKYTKALDVLSGLDVHNL